MAQQAQAEAGFLALSQIQFTHRKRKKGVEGVGGDFPFLFFGGYANVSIM